MIDYKIEIEIINDIIDRITSNSKLEKEDFQDICHILLRLKVLLQQTGILEKRGIE